MANSSPCERNQLEALAEEFTARKKNGESPTIQDYVDRHPDLAAEIRELFPVMEMLDAYTGPRRINAEVSSQTAELGPGTRLGEYQLIRRIGRGGMGVVYQAEHIVLGSQVAIKVLSAASDHPKLRERFLREASAAARMHHPNIVGVFDFGTYYDSLYYVMALVEGWSLSDILGRSQGCPTIDDLIRTTHFSGKTSESDLSVTKPSIKHAPLDSTPTNPASSSGGQMLWRWVATLGVQAADALEYAHSMGVIHRDVKPANLLLDNEGILYITDFGLAKVADTKTLTNSGDLLGTLRYMPPEAMSGVTDHRGDIYGLGLTLYEFCAGGPAFGGDDYGQLMPAISSGRIPSLRQRAPKIPYDLEKVIQKSIASDRSIRYRTASSFADDLRRFLQGQPVLARKTTWTYRTTRWIARNRSVTTLTCLLFILMLFAMINAIVSADRYAKVAIEKEIQRQSAVAAEAVSLQQTRLAKRNLIRASLSDARGWTTSNRPGQRIEAMKSLREAIRGASELGILDQYRPQFNSVAVATATLCDIPPDQSWQHPHRIGEYDPLYFNGDLSEYVCISKSETGNNCNIYRVLSGTSELVESIPIPNAVLGQSLMLSRSGNRIAAVMMIPGADSKLWTYDRTTGVESTPDYQIAPEGHDNNLFSFVGEDNLLFTTVDNRIVLFDADKNRTAIDVELPEVITDKQLKVVISNDESKAAIYADSVADVTVFNLESQGFKSFSSDTVGVYHLAWRSDDRQLAVLGRDQFVRIHDFERNLFCNSFRHSHARTTHIMYGNDNLLLSSGWNHNTMLHDTLSERRLLQLANFVHCLSADRSKAVFHLGSRLEIRPVIDAPVVTEVFVDGGELHEGSQVDALTGMAWIAVLGSSHAIDLSRLRIHQVKTAKTFGSHVAVDPLSRDVFVSEDDVVYRLPIRGSESGAPGSISIGPPDLIVSLAGVENSSPRSVTFDASGNRVVVSNRRGNCEIVYGPRPNWALQYHSHAEAQPMDIRLHPNRSVVTTSVHHGTSIETRDVATDKVLFRFSMMQTASAFTPHGKELVVASDRTLALYSTDDWSLLRQTGDDVQLKGRSFAISPDSEWIAVEGTNPRGVTLLDAKTLKPALTLYHGQDDPRYRIGKFDASGRFLISERGENRIGIWDFYRLREVFESLDLEWPLGDLGLPTPIRDSDVGIKLLWEFDSDLDSSEVDSSGQEPSALGKLGSSLTRTGLLDQFWMPRLFKDAFLPADAKNDEK